MAAGTAPVDCDAEGYVFFLVGLVGRRGDEEAGAGSAGGAEGYELWRDWIGEREDGDGIGARGEGEGEDGFAECFNLEGVSGCEGGVVYEWTTVSGEGKGREREGGLGGERNVQGGGAEVMERMSLLASTVEESSLRR